MIAPTLLAALAVAGPGRGVPVAVYDAQDLAVSEGVAY